MLTVGPLQVGASVEGCALIAGKRARHGLHHSAQIELRYLKLLVGISRKARANLLQTES